MNKTLLTIVLLNVVFLTNAMAQAVPPRVQIISRRDTVGPHYNITATSFRTVTVNVNLELSGDFDAAVASNNEVTFELIGGTLSKTPTFLNGNATTTVNLPASQWPGAGNPPAQQLIPLTLKIPAVDPDNQLSNDEVGQIIIQGHPSNFQDLVYSKNVLPVDTTYNPNKPFWVEVGANFDLLDGMEANNLFSGVFFHKYDIRGMKKNATTDRQKNLGMFAGVFESKTITTITNGEYGIHQYYDPVKSFMPGRTDSLRIFSGSGPIATKLTVRNVGLFISPQLRLSNGSANRDGLHFFISLWMEMQWQRFTWQQDYNDVINFDSSIVFIKDINKYRSKDLKTERDIKTHYYGIGFPVFFRETSKAFNENVHLFINPVIGFTNQPSQKYLDSLTSSTGRPDREWGPFYAIQFRLNEEILGISFSGEVRGLIKKNNAPLVTLVLSKKFDLSKFMMFK